MSVTNTKHDFGGGAWLAHISQAAFFLKLSKNLSVSSSRSFGREYAIFSEKKNGKSRKTRLLKQVLVVIHVSVLFNFYFTGFLTEHTWLIIGFCQNLEFWSLKVFSGNKTSDENNFYSTVLRQFKSIDSIKFYVSNIPEMHNFRRYLVLLLLQQRGNPL